MSGFDLSEYVDVAERIQLFYERYPDGRLVTVRHGRYVTENKQQECREFVFCEARAYRTPDDPTPCAGTAWEPIPGPTPYTKDSELMNAETAAWGRAIIAAGIPSKKVASSEEVRARAGANAAAPDQPDDRRTDAQNRKMRAVLSELEKAGMEPPSGYSDWAAYAKQYTLDHFNKHSSKDLTKGEAGKLIDHLEAFTVPFG